MKQSGVHSPLAGKLLERIKSGANKKRTFAVGE